MTSSYEAVQDSAAQEPGVETSTVAELIEESLSRSGRHAEAAAFRRRVAPTLDLAAKRYPVRASKDNFSKLIKRVRQRMACTISPHAKPEDAVLLISVEDLAAELGQLAVALEHEPAPRHPRTLFAAVDRLPRVALEDAEIDLGRKTPVPVLDVA